MRSPVRFLSIENILAIHDDTLKHEGGMQGIRDVGLLESAVAMPQSMFNGEYLHQGLGGMAAAYLYHLCNNHAFIDGNKRVAAFACVLFLSLNGVEDEDLPEAGALESITVRVASGLTSKNELTDWLLETVPLG